MMANNMPGVTPLTSSDAPTSIRYAASDKAHAFQPMPSFTDARRAEPAALLRRGEQAWPLMR